MSGLKKLASETAIYGVSTIAMRMLNYLLVPLYTQLFDPAAYGTVTVFYALLAFFNILLTYGMETTYFRFSGEDNKKVYSTALNSVIFTSLIFLLLTWFQSGAIAVLLNEEGQTKLVQYSLLILVLDAISALPFAYLRKMGKAKRFALLRSLNILLNIAFNLLFLYFAPKWVAGGWNFMGLFSAEPELIYIFIANFLASGITLLLLIPELRGLEHGVDLKLWRRMIVYALPLLLVGFAGMVNETFDRVIMEYLLPEETARYQIGVYGACYKLSILMSLFIQAFRFAAEPFFFAQKASGDRKIYARATHYFALFCFMIFLLVTIYLDIFKLLLRNEAFHEGLVIVPILLLANLFLGIYYNLSIWYKLADRTMVGAYIAIGGALLTIGLLFAFVPGMGYIGAAWATLIVYTAMMVAAYLSGQRFYPIPYKVRRFFFYLIFTLCIYLVSEMMNQITDTTSKYVWKTGLFLGFVLLVFIVEKPKKIITSQQNPKRFDSN
ncbi:MAG TPA: polysaccharide biosynthesis protein [Bacteroidetes bacterium]|nr:polysaccharide biosynthesis protein [Bacteroidota bacterium]